MGAASWYSYFSFSGILMHPHTYCMAASIQKEVADGKTHPALIPKPAKLPFIITKTENLDRLINRALSGSANKGCNGSGYSYYCSNATGYLFNIDARVCRLYWHNKTVFKGYFFG